jgi:hypothetical protein
MVKEVGGAEDTEEFPRSERTEKPVPAAPEPQESATPVTTATGQAPQIIAAPTAYAIGTPFSDGAAPQPLELSFSFRRLAVHRRFVYAEISQVYLTECFRCVLSWNNTYSRFSSSIFDCPRITLPSACPLVGQYITLSLIWLCYPVLSETMLRRTD